MNHGLLAVIGRDGLILFATRILRTFGYGFLSVVLVLYLAALGLDDVHIGVVLTLTLLGDAAISLWLTTRADGLGRRRVLRIGSLLIAAAGAVFSVTGDFWLLVIAATIGVISVNGNETGPFLAIEQASLSGILPDQERTRVFGWYNLCGSFAAAAGALAAGLLVSGLRGAGFSTLDSDRGVVVGYAFIGILLALAFGLLSPAIEVQRTVRTTIAGRLGLHRSRDTVLRLSGLFGIDAFAGAMVSQSLVAYWFSLRFGAQPALLGAIFFVANILAGFSALVAARLAARFGLVRTMVFTHLPSNVLLILVPLMPTLPLAALVLFLRFSISQMDVPARQSYVVAVVDPDERSAAAGVTGIARSVGSAPAPLLAAPLIGLPGFSGVPFLIGGGLKIVYDLLLYRLFVNRRPPEEVPAEPGTEGTPR